MAGIVQHQFGVAETVVLLSFVIPEAQQWRRPGGDGPSYGFAKIDAAAGVSDLLNEFRIRLWDE
jgi:hypothetical protein